MAQLNRGKASEPTSRRTGQDYQRAKMLEAANRMRQRLHIVAPLDKTSAQALDYLNRNDLQGSPLREGGQ